MQVKMPMMRKELKTGTMDWDSAVRICRRAKSVMTASVMARIGDDRRHW